MCWITQPLCGFITCKGVFDWWLHYWDDEWRQEELVMLSRDPEKASSYILNWKAKIGWEEMVRNKPENSTTCQLTGYDQFSRWCVSFKYVCVSMSASVGSPFIKLECTEGTSMGGRVHLGCMLWYVCELTRLKCLVFHYKIASWI